MTAAGRRQAGLTVETLGQAEVGDLGHAEMARGFPTRAASAARRGRDRSIRTGRPLGLAQQHVGRLQVAMHDAVLVGMVHGAGQRFHQLGGRGVPAAGCRPGARPGCRRRRTPARSRAGPLPRPPRRSARCWGAAAAPPPRPRAESGPGRRAPAWPGQDHLQGHQAIQAHLAGLVDDAHAAAAQLAQDLVAGHRGQHRAGVRHAPVRWSAARPGRGASCLRAPARPRWPDARGTGR